MRRAIGQESEGSWCAIDRKLVMWLAILDHFNISAQRSCVVRGMLMHYTAYLKNHSYVHPTSALGS